MNKVESTSWASIGVALIKRHLPVITVERGELLIPNSYFFLITV